MALYNVNHGTVLNNIMCRHDQREHNADQRERTATISYNNATYWREKSAGILLNNSTNNKVLNNTLFTNYVGHDVHRVPRATTS